MMRYVRCQSQAPTGLHSCGMREGHNGFCMTPLFDEEYGYMWVNPSQPTHAAPPGALSDNPHEDFSDDPVVRRQAENRVRRTGPGTPVKGKKDMVNSPAHYMVGGPMYEVILVLRAWGLHLNYCLANAIKYIARADHKGNKLEDLKKARWYLTNEIEAIEAQDTSCTTETG